MADTTGVQTETLLTGVNSDASGGEGNPPAAEGAGGEGNPPAAEGAGGEGNPPAAEGAGGKGNPPAAETTGDKGDKIVPETYADFTLPEGMQLDETALTEATPMFKELGLTQDQAQKVVDLYAKQIQAGKQKNIEAFNQLTNEWRTAAETDKEYGGDKFEENVKIAQLAVNKFGTQGLKQLLSDHGIGNHPEMIRFMVRVGHTLKEDVPGSNGSMSTQKADRISILYPNGS